MPEKSRIRDLRKHLEDKGYDVYFPAQKIGECTAEYIVVKNEGLTQVQGFSSDQRLYTIMVYVPVNNYSRAEELIDEIKIHMREIFPTFVSMRFETPPFFDDIPKAWMSSMQYRNNKQFFNN